MSDVLVRIEKAVPITIFELPEIKLRVDTLFDNMKDDIKARFDEVKAFITKDEGDKHRYGKIAYDEITDLFKIYFYKSILNEVVELTFTENGKYDMVANILEALSGTISPNISIKLLIIKREFLNEPPLCININFFIILKLIYIFS